MATITLTISIFKSPPIFGSGAHTISFDNHDTLIHKVAKQYLIRSSWNNYCQTILSLMPSPSHSSKNNIHIIQVDNNFYSILEKPIVPCSNAILNIIKLFLTLSSL